MVWNANNRRLIEVFLKLNPKGSVAEFAKCKNKLQKQLDCEIAMGHQNAVGTL
jgi:hypothetical protein